MAGTDPMPVKEAYRSNRFKSVKLIVFLTPYVSTYLVLEAEEPGVVVHEEGLHCSDY